MQDFAFLRHVTIGQYLPGESPIHRLDPRAKITLVSLLCIALMTNFSYLANALMLLLCLGLVALAGIPLRYILGTVRLALPFIIVLAALQLLFYNPSASVAGDNRVFIQWGPMSVSSAGLQLVLVSLARFVDLMILAGILTNTTPLSGLSAGLENMLRPFARLGLPAHELSLVVTIALRFVPILAEQLEKIMQAQASRGADLGGGGRLRFLRHSRAVVVMLVPLFLDAFRRAEDLILAMEARCYQGGRHRTRLLRLHLAGRDWLALGTGVFVTLILVVYRNHFPF